MPIETRQCQNCKNSFTIEPADFDFYEKIQVPPPTFCPQCRNQRRMAWRNERSLYKRRCNAPGHTEEIISMYAPDSPHVVHDAKFWWSDDWDPLSYGQPYDSTRSFFEQFSEVLRRTPALTLSNINSVDSDYTNYVDQNRGCYLIFGSGANEQIRYANKTMYTRDSQDLLAVEKSELCYECVDCSESYQLRYSMNSRNCNDSWFLYDCRNCTNCFGCANLVNKSYCLWNTQYSREEYLAKLKELNLTSAKSIDALKLQFYERVYLPAIHRFAYIINSTHSTGNNILNSKNCFNCFDLHGEGEDCKNLVHANQVKDVVDAMGPWDCELSYELVDCNQIQNVMGCLTVYSGNQVFYSINCHGSSELFGCTGLRNKKYCILNKQYSKEEYNRLKDQIVSDMTARNEYGGFFPIQISPFAYNETIAQEYFPLTKKQIQEAGYRWRDPDTRHYQATITAEQIPDSIGILSEAICNEVLGCAHASSECTHQCTTAFKITPAEFQFYKRLQLPLPKLCPNCRHYGRLAKRLSLKLWHRACMCTKGNHDHSGKCPNEFETPYSPERQEIIYCEQCYQAEVS